MIVYKCKMCGANLPIDAGKKIVQCEYCDTFQSVPSCDDEKKTTLFNRANHFRQNGEFDKAYSIYEHILEEDVDDPEVYWSIVLCKYGIEYVEDPATKKRKATVNRTQNLSILRDADYLTALEKSDDELKKFYMDEANYIDRVQKKILTIAKEEMPYDIFISYKEKTSDGNRTRSSVMAQNLYERLEKSGYRTFFSRISLEDKIGNEFEPYIYSALQSARVMLVVGTKKEEFEAPWVKNEWSRYLLTMKDDPKKKLIPCYCDIDVYDLPDEFQIFQGQDMSKIGFEQDLLRGIGKILTSLVKEERVVVLNPNERALKNAETYIILKNYKEALSTYTELCRQTPDDYRAWWGRIRCITENLMNTNVYTDNYKDFTLWLGYIRTLTNKIIYEDIINQYIEYLSKVARQHMFAELENMTPKATYIQHKTDGMKEELDKRFEPNEKSRETEQKINQIKKNIVDCRKSIVDLLMKMFRLNLTFVIQIGLICLWIYCLIDVKGHIGQMIMVMTFGGITILFLKSNRAEYKKCKTEKLELEQSIEELDRSIEYCKQQLDMYYQSLEENIEKNRKVIQSINNYVNTDKNKIWQLLLALMCKDIGIEKVIDDELNKLRGEALVNVD